ncbi:unnamed protein product [Allacma fusca]|uniref:Uncharacterized protein n=1 Tax=Allacma fusca TaxID=39272 RepID=A0A8J2PK07_9HEXA|nr:unnamed protein product [Allacma fusca]
MAVQSSKLSVPSLICERSEQDDPDTSEESENESRTFNEDESVPEVSTTLDEQDKIPRLDPAQNVLKGEIENLNKEIEALVSIERIWLNVSTVMAQLSEKKN